MPTIVDLENEVRVTGERYRAARSRFAATVRIFDQAPARDMELTQALTAAENAFIQAWTAFSKAKDALHAVQQGASARPAAPRA
jgi:hypothetical protein